MNNRRKLLVALGAGAFATPICLFAQQQQARVHRIGLLGAETPAVQADRMEALRAGLRDLGYAEGKNIVIEQRWAEGKYDRLPGLAAELARLKPDVLVTFGQKAAVAGKGATTTIPIVVPVSSDAIRTDLAATLSRPGGNITGSSFFGPELVVKRLELLREIAPRITRVGLLLNPADTGDLLSREALGAAAKSLKLSVRSFEVRAADELENNFSAMVKGRIEAIVVSTDTLFFANYKTIGNLATTNHLPSASGFKEFVEAGGLISYGVNLLELYRHAAVFVDKILRGGKPGDIPFEQPTRFELVVNIKTAKALGVKIPNSIMVRADKVIE
jgi:putative ABC transport system substrate-binding protein